MQSGECDDVTSGLASFCQSVEENRFFPWLKPDRQKLFLAAKIVFTTSCSEKLAVYVLTSKSLLDNCLFFL